jgi:dTDP-4-amino-4,6-dideoxygalactose transaminase
MSVGLDSQQELLSRPADIPFLDLAGTSGEVREEVLTGWADLVESGRFIGGPAVSRFESEWAAYCGAQHAVGLGNGTDALHLSVRALGLGPGDEVIVPANTFVATVEGVVLAGATPRFADVDEQTLLLTPETVEAQITSATRAILVVHLYGQMPDMDALGEVADEHGLLLSEDAAQAQGAAWRGVRAGAFGSVCCFSFYPGKNLGAFGDAGAVVTSDPEVAERLRSMRDHGRVQGGHYEHGRLGTNSRLDAVQALVLSAKMERLDAWNSSRRALAASYRELLPPGAATLVQETPGSEGVYHLMVARVRDRDRVREELAAQGIATGIHYPTPCHLMAPYSVYAHGPLPAVETAAGELVSLPMYPHLRQADVARVCKTLTEATAGSLG